MDRTIELGYNPDVTIKHIQKVLSLHFPECDQSLQTWGVNAPFIRLKKSFFVHAIVFIKQNPKKQKTIIGINGNMAPMAVYLFGFLLHYLLRGSFLDEVKAALVLAFSVTDLR